MLSGAGLPKGFEDLAPFVAEWGDTETQDERYRRRQHLPMERLDAYYKAVTPRLRAIFDHLGSARHGALRALRRQGEDPRQPRRSGNDPSNTGTP